MDAPYCVESCPTHALILIDPEDMAKAKWDVLRKGNWKGLNFVSTKGLSK